MFSGFLENAGSKEVIPAASLYLKIFKLSFEFSEELEQENNKKIENKVENSWLFIVSFITNK